MYESLKEFNSIIVTGPQRSGTRIAAKIIANDTEKDYIDEKYIDFHSLSLVEYYNVKGNCVIQCPGLSHLVHYIKNKRTLIIFMCRSINDITSSERRVWSKESESLELLKYGYTNGIISEIKYNFWESIQKPILGDRGREISYNSLTSHKLFIKDRKNFRWDQTTL